MTSGSRPNRAALARVMAMLIERAKKRIAAEQAKAATTEGDPGAAKREQGK